MEAACKWLWLHVPQASALGGVSEQRHRVLARSKMDKEASPAQKRNGPCLGPSQGRMWGSVETEPQAESQAPAYLQEEMTVLQKVSEVCT